MSYLHPMLYNNEDDRRICQPYEGNPCYDQKEEVSENDTENETDKGDEFLASGEFFE